jgi:hypothetical protein
VVRRVVERAMGRAMERFLGALPLPVERMVYVFDLFLRQSDFSQEVVVIFIRARAKIHFVLSSISIETLVTSIIVTAATLVAMEARKKPNVCAPLF